MDTAATGYVHSVESFGTLDGPGIRYVLFLQGCPLRCLYCHNPDTREPGAGRIQTAGETLADILTYRPYIARGGVTLSGGEPLLQPDFVSAILDGCRQHRLHTAIDTSGAVPLATAAAAIERADLILLDIKALDPALCIELTGLPPDNTLRTLAHCQSLRKPVWIRHVLVPGFTLADVPLKALAAYLSAYSCIQKVELLPFHKMGEYKWESLRLPYRLAGTPPPTEEQISRARAIFKAHALPA